MPSTFCIQAVQAVAPNPELHWTPGAFAQLMGREAVTGPAASSV